MGRHIPGQGLSQHTEDANFSRFMGILDPSGRVTRATACGMMQLREFARSIVESETLEGKLVAPPEDWIDTEPGEPLLLFAPGRSSRLKILPATEVKVPAMVGLRDKNQRPRILHAMANHELQAIELFAWAILAFPNTPASFRKGLLGILVEEQRHFRLYQERVEANGIGFGDLGVTGYFWNRAGAIRSPIEFSCVMGLTFENANLDFAREFAAEARAIEDFETASAIDVIHHDEIGHVAFGWQWLEHWKDPKASMWDAYLANTAKPLGPGRARGKTFDATDRRKAGLSEEFIQNLERTTPKAPGGLKRNRS
ncbi:MAG: ferritin-like domain-containing protein [Myxococcales bacterium]|nr:ferritin-like domain-containing protein [Myxococcales bacterium]